MESLYLPRGSRFVTCEIYHVGIDAVGPLAPSMATSNGDTQYISCNKKIGIEPFGNFRMWGVFIADCVPSRNRVSMS